MKSRRIVTLVLVATAASVAVLLSVTSTTLQGTVTPGEPSKSLLLKVKPNISCSCSCSIVTFGLESLCLEKSDDRSESCAKYHDSRADTVNTIKECNKLHGTPCSGFKAIYEDGDEDGDGEEDEFLRWEERDGRLYCESEFTPPESD
jgi:hypothetical protein